VSKFKYRFTKIAQTEFDLLEKSIQDFLLEQLAIRCKNPYQQQLNHQLKKMFKISCKHLDGYKYIRLLYQVIEQELVIEVVKVGKKPSVYNPQELLKRLKKK